MTSEYFLFSPILPDRVTPSKHKFKCQLVVFRVFFGKKVSPGCDHPGGSSHPGDMVFFFLVMVHEN